MAFDYLTVFSVIGIAFMAVLLLPLLKRKDYSEIRKYSYIGLVSLALDFIVEYVGTVTGHWTYNNSVFFIFGLIPVELLILFFAGGLLARFIYINMNKGSIKLNSNLLFYPLILITFIYWAIANFLFLPKPDMMPFAIAVGLWAITNISEKNRANAVILALLAAISDFASETIMIGSGSYWYKDGFGIEIPIIYALLTIGLAALIEKIDRNEGRL